MDNRNCTYVSSVSITIVGDSSVSSSKFAATAESAVAKEARPLSISPLAKNTKVILMHAKLYEALSCKTVQ